jgi:hypothetical protein
MKTSELTGAALDWAVAKCEGIEVEYIDDSITRCLLIKPSGSGIYSPSTYWAQGGEIIERERIRIDCPWNPGSFEATCKIDGVTAWVEGDTVLTAAMRCYVASKLGDEIDVPEELL